jgi:hypothetical protein
LLMFVLVWHDFTLAGFLGTVTTFTIFCFRINSTPTAGTPRIYDIIVCH